MTEKRARKQRYVTPRGEFMYPFVNRPDTQSFNGSTPKPAYKVRFKISEDSTDKVLVDGKESDETLKELIDRLVEENWKAQEANVPAKYKKKVERMYPYEEEVDEGGNPTGYLNFKFKQNAELTLKDGSTVKITVSMFDAKNRKIKDQIGNGSEGKVAFTTRPYGMVQGNKYVVGITLDFSAVQVLKLETYGGSATSYGFETEEGFESTTPDEGEVTTDTYVEDDDEF